jgi:hypothetical protein
MIMSSGPAWATEMFDASLGCIVKPPTSKNKTKQNKTKPCCPRRKKVTIILRKKFTNIPVWITRHAKMKTNKTLTTKSPPVKQKKNP